MAGEEVTGPKCTSAGLVLGAVFKTFITEAGVGAWQVLAASIPTGLFVCTLIYVWEKGQQAGVRRAEIAAVPTMADRVRAALDSVWGAGISMSSSLWAGRGPGSASKQPP